MGDNIGATNLTIADIATRDVVTIGAADSLREALELLLDHRISGAPVLAGGNVVGVLSASDILAFDSTEHEPPVGPLSGDWDPWLDSDTFEGDDVAAPFFMTANDTAADLVDRASALTEQERDVLDEHGVVEIMTRRLVALPPDTPVAAAAAHMLDAGVHRVLVMEGERLLGVATSTDFVRAVAERGLQK